MAFVVKSQGAPMTVFSLVSDAGGNRGIFKALPSLAIFGLAFFALGFAFGHGYWVVALWTAAAALAWIFMRGASDASLPPEGVREE